MNKGITFDISCDVCQDLIPLVVDGVASHDSEQLVKSHTAHCETCRSYLESGGQKLPESVPSAARILARVHRKLLVQSCLLTLVTILFSISLTRSPFLVCILPLAGIISYLILKKDCWLVALISSTVLFLLSLPSGFIIALCYAIFYPVGLLVGFGLGILLQFAFGGLNLFHRTKKEDLSNEDKHS